jgi:antitoxin FitA
MTHRGSQIMTSLTVRNLDPDLIEVLKQRASAHGRSAEAEHRAILDDALRRPARRSLAEILASMPDVGQDSDFARVRTDEPVGDVFA